MEAERQIFKRVFHEIRPRTELQGVEVLYRPFTSLTSNIRWENGWLRAKMSDLFQAAPPDVVEALAYVLICKLFRKPLPAKHRTRYRLFVNRKDTVRQMEAVRKERGRKRMGPPQGRCWNLVEMFEAMNLRYFHGLMSRPELGWSPTESRTILGHYDAAHHAIVLSKWLDRAQVPRYVAEYVMYHEMLHLRYPEERKGVRRCVHTAEFRAAEEEFTGFEAAKAWLVKACR